MFPPKEGALSRLFLVTEERHYPLFIYNMTSGETEVAVVIIQAQERVRDRKVTKQ